jgi:hypothetical protein
MSCASELLFGGTEGDTNRFQVLRTGTSFWRYGGPRVQFSCFALPDTFSAVRRASDLIFMFCTPGLVFGGNEGARCRFHVLRFRSRFPRYRGRHVPFSSFASPDSFSAVSRASGPVFMFCAPGHIFCGAECIGPRFHVVCARTHFRLSRGRRIPFSCFARRD